MATSVAKVVETQQCSTDELINKGDNAAWDNLFYNSEASVFDFSHLKPTQTLSSRQSVPQTTALFTADEKFHEGDEDKDLVVDSMENADSTNIGQTEEPAWKLGQESDFYDFGHFPQPKNVETEARRDMDVGIMMSRKDEYQTSEQKDHTERRTWSFLYSKGKDSDLYDFSHFPVAKKVQTKSARGLGNKAVIPGESENSSHNEKGERRTWSFLFNKSDQSDLYDFSHYPGPRTSNSVPSKDKNIGTEIENKVGEESREHNNSKERRTWSFLFSKEQEGDLYDFSHFGVPKRVQSESQKGRNRGSQAKGEIEVKEGEPKDHKERRTWSFLFSKEQENTLFDFSHFGAPRNLGLKSTGGEDEESMSEVCEVQTPKLEHKTQAERRTWSILFGREEEGGLFDFSHFSGVKSRRSKSHGGTNLGSKMESNSVQDSAHKDGSERRTWSFLYSRRQDSNVFDFSHFRS